MIGSSWASPLRNNSVRSVTSWAVLAFALGFVMSNVILTLFFFLFVTPIGLVARLFQKDFLTRKCDKRSPSYWIQCGTEMKTAKSYERQF